MFSISVAQPFFSPCPLIIWEQEHSCCEAVVLLVLLVLPRLAVESLPWGSHSCWAPCPAWPCWGWKGTRGTQQSHHIGVLVFFDLSARLRGASQHGHLVFGLKSCGKNLLLFSSDSRDTPLEQSHNWSKVSSTSPSWCKSFLVPSYLSQVYLLQSPVLHLWGKPQSLHTEHSN